MMNIDFEAANLVIVDNIETILHYFGIEYREGKNRIIMPCPVHGSDNDSSLCLFTDGNTSVGNFVCWTSHCEHTIGRGSVNLIKYLLDEKHKKSNSWVDVSNFIKSITGKELGTISEEERDRKKFTKFVTKKQDTFTPTISRNQVRLNLKIPSDYYISRGYSKEILSRYDIGLCGKKQDEMFMRTVVPVYNDEFKLIGRLGRSLFSQCCICNKYHAENRMCPTNRIEDMWAAKWRNSLGFNTGDYFYNLWYAKNHIQNSQSVILVEGCGDVLRLEEAGIKISLGLFGLELTERKLEILNRLGIMNVHLALDSDGAGQEATTKIYDKISKYFNVSVIEIGKKDIGDTSIPDVKNMFKELI
jgi:5S rRNA maturation endonuclease (ribonuclease M5)